MLEKEFQNLIARVKQYAPDGNFTLIEKAFEVATAAHSQQKRHSGEQYIIHPLGVAFILADMELDITSICAALLHDVLE
ncbi:MAG: HD domain-containing protein, partial [Oscillospiraceae bacterium]|nr:HD domain-containing protein [Oscillospiraceae bacterium]